MLEILAYAVCIFLKLYFGLWPLNYHAPKKNILILILLPSVNKMITDKTV